MTDQERQFLHLLSKSKAKTTQQEKKDTRTDTLDSFSQVVNAAVARAKLRQELSVHLSKLTASEAQFLKDLVDNEDVTQQQLEFAHNVLNTDPLYSLDDEDENKMNTTVEQDEVLWSPSVQEVDTAMNTKVRVQRIGRDFELIHCESRLDTESNDYEKKSESKRDAVSNESKGLPTQPGIFSYSTWKVNGTPINDNGWESHPILGFSKGENAIDEKHRVLSPPIMNSLRTSLPFSVAEDNFWLKFALTRDGANLKTLYDSIRQSSPTLLAIETSHGEVFGAFTSSPWRNHGNFYGSCEAFVWRLKHSRFSATKSIKEQVQLESEVDCFKWSRANRNVQFSNQTKLMVGGGCPDEEEQGNCLWENSGNQGWGMGIVIKSDLFQGSSCPCVTFQSPCLSQNGETFEAKNIEVWVSKGKQHLTSQYFTQVNLFLSLPSPPDFNTMHERKRGRTTGDGSWFCFESFSALGILKGNDSGYKCEIFSSSSIEFYCRD
jgi:hypothetical protein